MSINNVLSLCGGLALFLYGMHIMSNALESAAGDRMKKILEKLTSNPIIGILVGAGITAVIQSSSATTVMVVGFVNSQLMTLNQAVWIIMGANIGTTVTGLLIALDASKIAPLVAIIGVVMVTFVKNKKVNAIGGIFAGLGILFIGMDMMKLAMTPLQDSPAFINAMTTISNPLLAILLGAGFTALIQSSSASVGILQALALSGLIPLSSAIYIIFGQNIGTCITAVLASLGANRNAKRTTVIHLSFNIIGTIAFMLVASLVPFVEWMVAITDNPAAQIAYTHTCFNILTTLLLIPFGNKLAKLATIVMPIRQDEIEDTQFNIPLTFIDKDNIGSVTIALSSLRKEALEMLKLTQTNLTESIQALYGQPLKKDKMLKREKRINYMNYEITEYMTKVSSLSMNEQEATLCNALYKCFADIERIGDHAINIMQYSLDDSEYKLHNRACTKAELEQLLSLLTKNFNLLSTPQVISEEDECFNKISTIEDRIDELTERYRQEQINRLYDEKVTAIDCISYSAIMTDIERVGDHMMNIIEECKRCDFTLGSDRFDKVEVLA